MKHLIIALLLTSHGFAIGSGNAACCRPLAILDPGLTADLGPAISKLLSLPGIGFTRPAPSTPVMPSSPQPATFLGLSEIHSLIRTVALKHRVPAAFVKSVVAAESNFNPDAVSPKGAIGLMQLMPDTAREYGADPTVPQQNIEAGTRYLKFLIARYKGSLKHAIAAYNAGPGVVDRYRGVPPYPETRAYVSRVLGFLRRFQRERA